MGTYKNVNKEFLKETYLPANCLLCNALFERKTLNKLYCSQSCINKAAKLRARNRRKSISASERTCKVCEKKIPMMGNTKHCSKECVQKSIKISTQKFKENNPGSMSRYNVHRVIKNPLVWKEKTDKDRLEIIAALGAKCCVPFCNTINPLHLHVDYIPTMIGTGKRHPRHCSFILRNLDKFRLICANHHYELTITGGIEGTDITQITQTNQSQHQLFAEDFIIEN